MPQDVEKDPISKAYDSIWDLAEQSVRLKSIVRPGNRIKYNLQSDIAPDKEEISNADLPELVLVPVSGTAAIRANSSSSKITMRFEWWLSTGQQGITNAILPLTFAVYAAMVPWPSYVAGERNALKWRGQSFIKKVDLLEAQFGLTRSEQNRGIGGWGSVWGTEIEMWFRTSDLIDALAATPFVRS